MPASKFTQEIFNDICKNLENGISYLKQRTANPELPHRATLLDWMRDNEVLSQQYARARDTGFEHIAEDCLEIADETSKDTFVDGEGFERPDKEYMMRSKLRIETRLKLLASWAPKKYGSRVDITSDGDKIQQTVIMMPSNNREDSK